MPMIIIRNDITKMKIDIIVNAANTALKMGGGVCGAIFSGAGAEKLQEECDALGKCNVGQAVITSGYSLPAKYIIHTVGPIWDGGNSGEANSLHNCYINSLKLALKYKCKSIAFPLISSGIYGYPKDKALQIAISAIGEFLINHEMTVYLVVYDKKAFVLSGKLFSAIEKYIDDNYVEEHQHSERQRNIEPYEYHQFEDIHENYLEGDVCDPLPQINGKRSLEEVISQLDESFSKMLLRLIDEKGMTDVETYKKANIDRKLFSKIRSCKGYNPSKVTSIAFAIAIRLSLDETRDLLNKAGYTLSHSNKFDVIIEYFIEEGNYNIYEINEALFAFEQVLLGV
ncbi:MAG TPA: macro domain-containing protein [Clostridium sp.]|uniref:macro domain-containing protein n=1 Tax=Clostridium sp. TaxID=1506 RepID=UPI002F926F80